MSSLSFLSQLSAFAEDRAISSTSLEVAGHSWDQLLLVLLVVLVSSGSLVLIALPKASDGIALAAHGALVRVSPLANKTERPNVFLTLLFHSFLLTRIIVRSPGYPIPLTRVGGNYRLPQSVMLTTLPSPNSISLIVAMIRYLFLFLASLNWLARGFDFAFTSPIKRDRRRTCPRCSESKPALRCSPPGASGDRQRAQGSNR